MGDFVHSASVQPHDVVTLEMTKGLSPVLVILKTAVAGFFHKMVPKACASLSKVAFGCA
jgi:hypothetical protein